MKPPEEAIVVRRLGLEVRRAEKSGHKARLEEALELLAAVREEMIQALRSAAKEER